MRLLPDALWYDPADLGFNGAVIAGAGSLAGNIVGWAAAYGFSSAVLFLSYTGAASTVTVRSQGFDIDGQTSLEALANLWVAVTGTGSADWYKDNQPRASIGTIATTDVGRMLGPPALRFNILNNDGVNAATVTMRAILRRN